MGSGEYGVRALYGFLLGVDELESCFAGLGDDSIYFQSLKSKKFL
jgi:hypothetical protein